MAYLATPPKLQFFSNAGEPLAGGKLYTYAAGTTTPQVTYTDQSGGIANTNPIILDARGECDVWLGNNSYKFKLTDPNDVELWTVDDVQAEAADVLAQLAASGGSALIGFIQTGTGAVARTAQAKMRDIVSVADFGAAGDNAPGSAATNTAAINAAIASLTSGGTVYFPHGIYYTNQLLVNNANINFQMDNGVTLRFATLGANQTGITVSANNFKITGGKLQGPASGVFVNQENGIKMLGTSTSIRKSGLTLLNVEITAFGCYGIYAQFVDNIVVDSCNFHDIGYSGATFLSCNHGRCVKSEFVDITPGTSGNMYGISLTHDSTGYNVDPNAGTKLAANPFCWDWYVAGNYVENIAWEGIDCHGGYEIVIDGNHVYATYGGIACSSSSGDASAYAGWDNIVCNNVVDARNSDGTLSGFENDNYGINLNGGSVVQHQQVICSNNILIYKGILGNTNSGAVQAVYVRNGNITGNIFKKWGGNAINVIETYPVTITENQFLEIGGAFAGAERCISLETAYASGSDFTIQNNIMWANGGTAGYVGVYAPNVLYLPYFDGNDFDAATGAPYQLPSAFTLTTDRNAVYNVTVDNAGTGEVIDLTPMQRYGYFQINVTSDDAASVVTNLTNGKYGQQIVLYSPGATAWVFNRDNAALSGGTNFTAAQYSTLTLVRARDTTPFWVELGRSANS